MTLFFSNSQLVREKVSQKLDGTIHPSRLHERHIMQVINLAAVVLFFLSNPLSAAFLTNSSRTDATSVVFVQSWYRNGLVN